MNSNPGIQNVGTVAWSGTTAYDADIRKFVRFGWVFEVATTLVADTIFKVQAAPPSDADACAAGVFADVPEISICDKIAAPGPAAQITLPAGTPAGTICSGTIPCRPNAFVRLAAVSGNTSSVRAVLIRQGPTN